MTAILVPLVSAWLASVGLAWTMAPGGNAPEDAPAASFRAAGPVSPRDGARPAVAEAFVGTWRLVRIERHNARGEVLSTDSTRRGYFMFDAGGHAMVQHLAGDRPGYAGPQPTADEAQRAIGSVLAYFGTYAVDEAGGFVTIRVEGSANPNQTGTEQKRFYEFRDDLLILQPPPTVVDGEERVSRIVWQRVR